MKVQDIMTANPRCVGPGDTLAQAAQVMRALDVGAVPVCHNGKLAGMLTDRDISVRAVADGRDPSRTTVRETMSEGIVYVFDDQDVSDAAHIMEQKQIRRLPVLDRDKRLVGIVSLGDIAVQAGSSLGGEALRDVSEPAGRH
jgi:CBS domain-containing protein